MKKLTIKECKSICKYNNERIVDVDIYDNGYMAKVVSITKFHLVNEYTLSVLDDGTVKMYINVLTSGRLEDPIKINRHLYK